MHYIPTDGVIPIVKLAGRSKGNGCEITLDDIYGAFHLGNGIIPDGAGEVPCHPPNFTHNRPDGQEDNLNKSRCIPKPLKNLNRNL